MSRKQREATRSAHLLGELVGLALRTVTVCPMQLNLLPATVVTRQDLEKRQPFFIAAAACILLALLGWSAYYTRAAHVAQQTTQLIGEKNATMHVAEAQLDKIKKQITALDDVAKFRQEALPRMAQAIVDLDHLSAEAGKAIANIEAAKKVAGTFNQEIN